MWFIHSQAEKHFQRVAADFASLVGRVARAGCEQDRNMEPFQGLHKAWNQYMRQIGRDGLTIGSIGADSMKYPALTEPYDGVVMAAQFVGLYIIPGFKESKYAHNLNLSLIPFAQSQVRDGGDSLNEAFKRDNPRSFDYFLSEFGRAPFSNRPISESISVLPIMT